MMKGSPCAKGMFCAELSCLRKLWSSKPAVGVPLSLLAVRGAEDLSALKGPLKKKTLVDVASSFQGFKDGAASSAQQKLLHAAEFCLKQSSKVNLEGLRWRKTHIFLKKKTFDETCGISQGVFSGALTF